MNQSISGSWYPVLDPVLFPEHPAKLLATGQYNKIPIIDGVNTDEGTDNAYFGINTDQQMIEHLTTVGHPVMTPDNVGVLMNIYSPINLTDPSPYGIPFKTTVDPVTAASLGLGTQYKRYAAIVGDLYYHGPLLHDAELYAKHSTPEAPVYIYRFDTLPWNFTTGSTQTFQQIPNVSTKALTASYKGRAHFSETPFVFRNPAFYGPDLEYKKLADQMSAMWVNFVNTGNPTPVITQNASQYMCFSSAANTNVSATVAGGLWEPYFLPATVPAADRDDGSVVGKVLVIRTDSRGSSILESNNWRLAGRSFIVKKMQQVYGE
jgi:carboxylesterase type B